MDIPSLFSILSTAEKLKCSVRHSWTSTGRQESVAEHCFRLALLADLLREEFPGADMDRVVQLCLYHDLGEALTGDIPAFEKTSEHEEDEKNSLLALLDSWPEPWKSRLSALYQEYQEGQTEEARICRALDKLETLFQHLEAGPSTWIPLEYELNLTYGQEACQPFPVLKEIREALNQELKKM